ncbi:MAG: phenylalanine--tRNA ligase beta subunit-related protein [Candidatus Micrarchaeota archaeon]
MKFKIDSKIFEKFPDLNIGIVTAKGIDNQGNNKEIIDQISENMKEIRSTFNTGTLSQNPKIDSWRKAYSSFGAKPKKYRCSVENLYRMILEGMDLRHINKVVDIYNYISIKNIIPVGGDDTDKIDGNIILKFAHGNESFTGLNSEETKNPKEGEVVYVDDKEVLCRRWNWRECDKSKMTEETKNVALVVEGLPPVTKEEVETIINELSGLVQTFCGGEIKMSILNSSVSEVDL